MPKSSHNATHCQQKYKSIQQLFFDHCATIIQSRFRAYLQRKRYRQFLPIYRRFKQLMMAVWVGYKTRKIMGLQVIKKQIKSIRQKTKKGQNAHARMQKRQLIDQIKRLGKRGAWVQMIQKQTKSISMVKYGNVLKESKLISVSNKPVSLKTVFGNGSSINNKSKVTSHSQVKNKKQSSSKAFAKKKQPIFQNQSSIVYEDYQIRQQNQTKTTISLVNISDQRPIKSNPCLFQDFKDDSQPIQRPFNVVEKKIQKKQVTLRTIKNQNKQVDKIQQKYKIQKQQTKNKQQSVRENTISESQVLEQPPKRKKTKLTLTLACSSIVRCQSSVNESINNSTVGNFTAGSSLVNSHNESISSQVVNKKYQNFTLIQRFQGYNQAMYIKQQQIRQKISQFKYKHSHKSFGINYKKILDQK